MAKETRRVVLDNLDKQRAAFKRKKRLNAIASGRVKLKNDGYSSSN